MECGAIGPMRQQVFRLMRVTLTPDCYAPLWRLAWLTTPPLYLCGYLRREDAEAKARAEGWEIV